MTALAANPNPFAVYPAGVTTPEAKLNVCLRMNEVIRVQHNAAKNAGEKQDAIIRTLQLHGEMTRYMGKGPGVCPAGPDLAAANAQRLAALDTRYDAALVGHPILIPRIIPIRETPDPYENFTTATVDNTGSYLTTIAANDVVWTNMPRTAVSKLYWDRGEGHFPKAFSQKLDGKWTANNGVNTCTIYWGVTNSNAANMVNWAQGAMLVLWTNTGTPTFQVYSVDNGWNSQSSGAVAQNTWYYIEPIRSGANGQTLTILIYTGSHGGTLFATLAVLLTNDRTYRYDYYATGRGDASGTGTLSGEIVNLDLGEAVYSPAAAFLLLKKGRMR